MDEAILGLQEQPKKAFLEPLSWGFAPHEAIILTAEAVLLLFNIDPTTGSSENSADKIWQSYWALWIVKNIDAHRDGWEWMALNEPTGLFTKPYALSTSHLDRVYRLLAAIKDLAPENHRCWHRLPAYAWLRSWVVACAEYVHMMQHCLPGFPGYEDVRKRVTPPKRTPKANVWFRFVTAEGGVEYYYNRLDQSLTLERPDDFDGGLVTSVPVVVQDLVREALAADVAVRLELERRSKQQVHAQLFAEDEWIECVDPRSLRTFYYSMKHYRVADAPPENGVFISHTDSAAYAAVLKLQAVYRRRRLARKTVARRAKRNSLPVFSSVAGKRSANFY